MTQILWDGRWQPVHVVPSKLRGVIVYERVVKNGSDDPGQWDVITDEEYARLIDAQLVRNERRAA